MAPDVAPTVSKAVSGLRKLVETASTVEVVGSCLANNFVAANDLAIRSPLSSPARQISFFLSLLVSTPEPESPKPFDADSWARAVALLNDAFGAYFQLYFPESGKVSDQGDAWYRSRTVAMQAFFHYWHTGLLATTEQVSRRIDAYLVPFDDSLRSVLGITASEFLRISRHLVIRLQESADALLEATQVERDTRLAILKEAEKAGLDIAGLRRLTAAHPTYRQTAVRLKQCLDDLLVVDREDVISKFGEAGSRYWELQTIARGSGPAIGYPTDASVVDKRPVILLSSSRGQCPTANELTSAVLRTCESALTLSDFKPEYLAHRDRTFEGEIGEPLKQILGPRAEVWPRAFETNTSQFEHDFVMLIDKNAFIVEAKASPPVAPFRDPDKAFTRLKHAFAKDTGIQAGFEQAERLRARFARGERIALYSKDGTLLREIDSSQYNDVFAICITRDNFGPLATDLSFLLEKPADVPFPWVANVFDLSSLADAWRFFGWGKGETVRYLSERQLCHGKVYGSDELEYAGYFIRHGGLRSAIDSKADLMTLNPAYSDFFEELYRHQNYGGPRPNTKITKPVIMDLRKSLSSDEPVFVSKEGTIEKRYDGVSRNALCPCGSGKRFKRCHGRPRGLTSA